MNKKIRFFMLITILPIPLLSLNADAVPVEEWNKKFGSTGYDSASYVLQATDGGYIISGRTCPHDPSQCGPWLIKTDARGNEEWNKTFLGVNGASSVQQTGDGGYIVAGTTSFGAGESYGSYAWLRKVGGEQTGTAKTPAASPTETPTATPTQTPGAVSNETQIETSLEKAAGFEIVLAVSIFLTVFIARRKRN